MKEGKNMCTAITLQTAQQENFFGRSMDFSYAIDPSVYVFSVGYEWGNLLKTTRFTHAYSFIGIGQELEGNVTFVDGVNEKGFAVAALYFPGYAQYQSIAKTPQKPQIAALEVSHYLLGKCEATDGVKEALAAVDIVSVADPVTQTVAPLHWIATDKSGKCIVIEHTEKGLFLWENEIGVLTNSPDFSWHMTNLRNYMNAVPQQREQAAWNGVTLRPFGNASGTDILPGGYTPPARFVRTAYQKSFVPTPQSRGEAVNTCFHILEGVSIPKGVVVTSRDTVDYTRYVAFMNTATCEYFFKTYENGNIRTAKLPIDIQKGSPPQCYGKLKRPAVFEQM